MAKFQKGQSGNPGGRSKEDVELRDLARTYTKEAVERLVFWMQSDHPKASPTACSALLDRGYGKPKQEVEAGPELTKLILAWAE